MRGKSNSYHKQKSEIIKLKVQIKSTFSLPHKHVFFLYCISEMAFKLHNEQKLAIYEGLKMNYLLIACWNIVE